MSKLLLISLLIASASHGFALTRVTVQQLQSTLGAPGADDATLAQQIGSFQLTERLSPAAFWSIAAKLPGPLSHEALVAIADQAEFLAPPASEIPPLPAPDAAAQTRILALATDYVQRTLPNLPDFIATREILRFQDRLLTADFNTTSGKTDLPLQVAERSISTVRYRNGREVATHTVSTDGVPQEHVAGLDTSGAFGPILGTVLNDSADAKILWSRWEQTPNGPAAVFHFRVPKGKSHYQVSYCCVPRNPRAAYHGDVFKQFAAYHGEITVDPATGTILRLALNADLDFMLPIVRADILVEYGPVEIGGQTYICPLKSISISQALAGLRIEGWHQIHYISDLHISVLSDSLFEDYQRFRGDVRILTGSDKAPQEQSAPETPSGSVDQHAHPQ